MITPTDLAKKHLGEFKTKGNEIIPRYCPFCNGGKHHDKETFALNTDKLTYNCKRASCGVTGTFNQLCREFGEQTRDNFELRRTRREYKDPKTEIKPITEQIKKYMELRKISAETYQKRYIGSDGQNIVFPYYDENKKLSFVKFRPPRKLKKGDRKMWREKDCRPILWGMHDCDPSKPLVITEGEFDALALTEAGIENAVSVPSGAEDMTWLDECWDWLNQFEKIILFGDSDEPGQEMVRKLILKLGEYRCYTVENNYKDANELLFHEGKEAVKKVVDEAKPIPVFGLIDLSDVTPVDVSKLERVKSNIRHFDRATGGFYMGELSVWTGKRGEGKSTVLGQMLIEAVEQNYKVCAYSGELRADRFQYWINLQIAGPDNAKVYHDNNKDKEITYVDKDTVQKIKQWYKGKFFLCDNSINSSQTEEHSILKLFEYAVKRYDCKVFLVDNLMTAKFDTYNDRDYYRRQSLFVEDLANFAKTFNVHVHLVAHPRKTQGNLENDDISGTGDITNRADNVFVVNRIYEDEELDCDTVVTIKKHRMDGSVIGEKTGLNFDMKSKRFYLPSAPEELRKKYGWEADHDLKQLDIGTEIHPPEGVEQMWG